MTGTGEDRGGGGRLLTLIGAAWQRVRRFFSGGDTAVPEPASPEAPTAGPGAGEPAVQGLSSILGPVVAMPGPEGPGVGTITSSGDMGGWSSPGASAREPDDSSGPGMDLQDPGELAVGTITTSGDLEGGSSPHAPKQEPVVEIPGPGGPGVGIITSSRDLEGEPFPHASAPEPEDSSGPGLDRQDPGKLVVRTITSSGGMEGESTPDTSAEGEMLPPHEDPDPLPTDPAPGGPGTDLSRWTVTLHTESPFAKVGRLYLAGNDLVIRSDLDRRGFSIALADVALVLDGDPGPVRLIDDDSVIGSARTSSSGKAMNFSIPPFLYTTPLRSLCPVLDEQARKAPLFVGREVVEPARGSG